MTHSRRSTRLAVASLLAATVLSFTGLAAGPACSLGSQWHLDIDYALDAVGVAPGMIVGEAGAGDGYFTIPLARRVGVQGAVLANDISRRSLSSLESKARREGLGNIQTVIGEVDDPRFPRRDLELVVLVHAFHDFDKPVEWLVNLKKYLRLNAAVAIIDRDPAQGAESHFWPRDRISRYAEEAGYQLVKSADAETGHLILMFTPRQAAERPGAPAH